MTPKEVLDDFVKDLSEGVERVYYPNVYDNELIVTSFALRELSDCAVENIEPHKVYHHKTVATKLYHDEGCAAYKMMKYLKSVITDETNLLFWRCIPDIERLDDFDRLVPLYRTYARFSIN